MQVFTKNLLGLGKSEPVRQLKKAGVIFIRVEQHLQIHISGAKIRKICTPQAANKTQNRHTKATRQQGLQATRKAQSKARPPVTSCRKNLYLNGLLIWLPALINL
jgi:ABC-type hemin transport system substrate-binding protein